jgi:hypothetical protein
MQLKRGPMLSQVMYHLCLVIVFTGISRSLHAQDLIITNDAIPHHILKYNEIRYLEDTSSSLTFSQASSKVLQAKFTTIQNFHVNRTGSTHWYKFKIQKDRRTKTKWVLEVFDQTIQDITIFSPDVEGKYKSHKFGTSFNFDIRPFAHKNFLIIIDELSDQEFTYFVRIHSSKPFTSLFVVRDLKWFVGYALNEYLAFGLFYGMIVVFSMYNLLMFVALKDKKYIYYIIYNISIALYEMSNDGLAFQYLWPGLPWMNSYADGFFLWCSVISILLFTHEFLGLRHRAPYFARAVWSTITLRSIYFIIAVFNNALFDFKGIEILSLLLALSAAIYIFTKGYRPARFLIIGYSVLMLGLLMKTFIYLEFSWIHNGPATHYSLSYTIIIEMIFVSFAIGDSIRILKSKKERTQRRMIDQLRINEKLQHTLNAELSILVDQRTKELSEKTDLVERQHQEILKMNRLLQMDNEVLNTDIQTIRKARVMSDEVDFEEFSRIYPNRETCFKYLAELKWSSGYTCKRCGNTHFSAGLLPYSRRCSKCGYDESVLSHTIFHNSRIPINKTFYILFLVYITRGRISSYELSKQLNLRQSTCWTYNNKMQKVLKERTTLISKAGKGGWSLLIMDSLPNPSTSAPHSHAVAAAH